MKIVKSVLFYNANTVEKGNIFSTVMEVVEEKDDVLVIKDNNGYTEELIKDFKGRFFIEEDTVHLIKVALYKRVKEDDNLMDVFQKNEKNVKKKALIHVRNTILMYRELYKNIYKTLEKFDVKKVYDKDELAEWGKIGKEI